MKWRPAWATSILGNNYIVLHVFEWKMKTMLVPYLTHVPVECQSLDHQSSFLFILYLFFCLLNWLSHSKTVDNWIHFKWGSLVIIFWFYRLRNQKFVLGNLYFLLYLWFYLLFVDRGHNLILFLINIIINALLNSRTFIKWRALFNRRGILFTSVIPALQDWCRCSAC